MIMVVLLGVSKSIVSGFSKYIGWEKPKFKTKKLLLLESAVYPSTLCAERVAIYSAISKGITDFKAIAIVSKSSAKPCGSCRQIIYEYLGNIPIYISNGIKEEYETYYIKDLLPYPFDII